MEWEAPTADYWPTSSFGVPLAAWGTLALIGLFAVVVVAETQEQAEAVGAVLGIIGFMPTIIGTGLGIACFERRLENPPSLWGGLIWNIVNLSVWLLLVIVGLFL